MEEAWIDPASGVATAGSGILEAFKPGSGPNLATAVIGVGGNGLQPVQPPGFQDEFGNPFAQEPQTQTQPAFNDGGGGGGNPDFPDGFVDPALAANGF